MQIRTNVISIWVISIMMTVKHFAKIGIKPAGGIRDLNDSIIIYKIVREVLGKEWLDSKLLRIGASSLYDNLINEHKTRFGS